MRRVRVRAAPRSAKTEPLPGRDRTSTAWPSRLGQALHDGETEAEALAALARRIVELMELLENRLKLLFGDADAGVPDLDAQLVAAPPAAEQDLARVRCI